MLRSLAVCLSALLFTSAMAEPLKRPAGAEAAAIEARIDALLKKMTIEEKVGQLNLRSRPHNFPVDQVRAGKITGFFNVVEPSEINMLRRAARESRLGIPLIFGLDAVGGYRTSFVLPIGQAATWNPALIEQAAYWTSYEARAVGVNWTFAPMADLSRDPRWGRVSEGAGEDPHLAQIVTEARTNGYQRGGLAATAKHYVGYGAPDGGRDYNSTYIPPSLLHDLYLPPFKGAMAAKTETFMAAFNALNGMPATAHKQLLRDVLKGQWGFDGFVVSDFNSIRELKEHGIAATDAEAARKAMLAGVDVDMEGQAYLMYLPDEVKAGRVPMALIDDAVRRVLRVKFRIGLFSRPDVDEANVASFMVTPPARAAAREVARESIILLKNEQNLLPIRADVKRIAVIGSQATYMNDFNWTGPGNLAPTRTDNLLEAIRKRAGGGVEVVYAEGMSDENGLAFKDRQGAIDAAKSADLVIAILGEGSNGVGEATSRAKLDLPGIQEDLLADLAATGKPVVLIATGGRPLALGRAEKNAQAILQLWHPGTEGRAAMAEILTGSVNPSGKAPMTYPRSVGQVPIYYNQLRTGRPSNVKEPYSSIYIDEDYTPLYPFGWGLSYSDFKVYDLRVASEDVALDGTLVVKVKIRNKSGRAGKETVQIYTRQLVASRSRPMRELKAFEKVELAGGEVRELTFRIKAQDLGFHDDDGKYGVEAGPFQVWAGTSAAADLMTPFRLVDAGKRK